MDIQIIRGLGTLVIVVAFISLILWAFSGRRQKAFDDATLLPFADDPEVFIRVPPSDKHTMSDRQ